MLVVEDDEPVRAVTTRVLRRAGWVVFEANGGRPALDLLEQGLEIDLLLTDLVMPDVDGLELAIRTRAQRPELTVLFVSGYAAEVLGQGGPSVADIPLLAKPYQPRELLTQLSELLRATGAAR